MFFFISTEIKYVRITSAPGTEYDVSDRLPIGMQHRFICALNSLPLSIYGQVDITKSETNASRFAIGVMGWQEVYPSLAGADVTVSHRTIIAQMITVGARQELQLPCTEELTYQL